MLPKSKGACVVHCDNSTGRTGLFIGLMTMMDRIDAGEQEVDIFKLVFDMRTARMKMVNLCTVLFGQLRFTG